MPADKEARRIVLIAADVEQGFEDEFNQWYDYEHLPERAALPGFLSARRFVAESGEPKYLTMYEVENGEVLTSPAYSDVSPPSQWQTELTPHIQKVVRTVYREITHPVPPEKVKAATRPATQA
ncbi:hypothetical protein I1A62_03650 (plasmid) [Rhodococcus sp. USK10]|uniref:DUF4286 family protein n=1 Tax=Rhodococcus sp. USK10 TaxID=2789739 RepID=UPI001C5D41C5|nr:DUF4286 family protein [Rhodococcus sp. USK10]QYB00191.1 hypothetical protein I1A62_03650 [Rhodococcus sp. USK10]